MKGRKNVLVIAVAGIVGGLETVLLTAIPLLQKKGYRFVFAVNEKGPAIAKYTKIGCPSVIIDDDDPKSLEKFKKIIKKYQIDLVHNNELNPFPFIAASDLAIPKLLHIHGQIENMLDGWPPQLIEERVSACCKLADFTIGCSKFATNQLAPFIKKSKLKCVYDGILTSTPRQGAKPNTGPKNIGMIAHFYPIKRHADFILAAKKILDSKHSANFFIAGHCWINDPDQELYFAKLQKLIEKLSLSSKIKIYKNLADISQLQKSMNIFVQPSVGEGLSISLLEAMAQSKPVVVTRSGGMAEVVKNGQNGLLVEVKNPQAIAKAIIKLLENDKLAAEVAQNARKTVEKRFNITRFVKELSGVYNHLAS